MTATAWSYLRVSSAGQTTRAYSEEGYSIEAQREDCARKARTLEADVVSEFVDSAQTARVQDRPALKAMMARLRSGDVPTYIIFHKVDRFARNRRDDANLWFDIVSAGAEVVSATENIDASASGRLTHGILATIAEYYSLNLSAEAKKGLHKKARLGGTPGQAPIGYRNVRENIAGREIRTIAIDEQRAPHIQWAFTAYASGAYTLDTLLVALKKRGLTARATAKQPERSLSRSQLARMLQNPYYVGVVRYGGAEYQGRHPRLVDDDTFTRAKAVLEAHNAAEERSWKHTHYLKGSLRCRSCGSRLTLAPGRGKGGTYWYFVCIGRIKQTGCHLPYLAVGGIEQRVARKHGSYSFTRDTDRWHAHLAEVRELIDKGLGKMAELCAKDLRHQRAQIAKLEAERESLLQAFYAKAIPVDLLKKEQDRITGALYSANQLVAAAEASFVEAKHTLHHALDLLEDPQALYEAASDAERRQLNQAFFEHILIDSTEDGDQAVPTEPFATLSRPDTPKRLRAELCDNHALSFGQGSNVGLLAERPGRLANPTTLARPNSTGSIAWSSCCLSPKDAHSKHERRRGSELNLRSGEHCLRGLSPAFGSRQDPRASPSSAGRVEPHRRKNKHRALVDAQRRGSSCEPQWNGSCESRRGVYAFAAHRPRPLAVRTCTRCKPMPPHPTSRSMHL